MNPEEESVRVRTGFIWFRLLLPQ